MAQFHCSLSLDIYLYIWFFPRSFFSIVLQLASIAVVILHIFKMDKTSKRKFLEREIFTYSVEDIEDLFSISKAKPYYEQLDKDISNKLFNTMAKKQKLAQSSESVTNSNSNSTSLFSKVSGQTKSEVREKPEKIAVQIKRPLPRYTGTIRQKAKRGVGTPTSKYLDDFELFYKGNYFEEFKDLPSQLAIDW
ncbi:unnamed protein product [Kuraishia capsulata CBS 1993]|uniref:Uncharacterized protein n=1 Tax=Kuraishia capsulata CBS 1993 TaxID=1382522 RepID=W6MIN8_9ASCO|nr:uncharacterized protein KUCA_T00001768001 [Kuraishia capsulata CBS 1993]CDK25798.1 unnamed protein product [Kuraishia capsulata CBS 1993]